MLTFKYTYSNSVPKPISNVAKSIFLHKSPFLSNGLDLAPQFPQHLQQQKHRPQKGIKMANKINIATIINKPT